MVTDGWYIDLNWPVLCNRPFPAGRRPHTYLFAAAGPQPAEILEFVDIGQPETGFALQQTMTSKPGICTLPDGAKKQTEPKSETLVTQLEERPIAPALFEIPPGFKHVEHIDRNPSGPCSSSQVRDLWERFKTRVSSLFGPPGFLVAGRSKVQTSTVEIDGIYEVLFFAESSSGVFHPLNFGIDGFAGGVRDGVG